MCFLAKSWRRTWRRAMKTSLESSFCAMTADSKSRRLHCRITYFRGATPVQASLNNLENSNSGILSVILLWLVWPSWKICHTISLVHVVPVECKLLSGQIVWCYDTFPSSTWGRGGMLCAPSILLGTREVATVFSATSNFEQCLPFGSYSGLWMLQLIESMRAASITMNTAVGLHAHVGAINMLITFRWKLWSSLVKPWTSRVANILRPFCLRRLTEFVI